MQNRRAIILESIKKLLKLGISDPEIVLHLEEVGVKEPEARELIAEAKGMPRSEIPTSSSSSTVLQEIKEEIQETPLEREIDFPIFPEPEPEPAFSPPTKFKHTQKPKPISTANLADLWEKGILQTITNKLQEMKRLRDQIENVIDKKIEKSLQKETKKMDALLKSQQTLVLAKMNAALDDKTKEVSELIDAKIKELKKIREEKEKTISSMDIKQDMVKETFSKLSEELEGTQKERKKSLENFNASLIKVKSQFEETIEDARQKLVALEERATQTLELETAIIDGMVKESQSRIDQMALEKVDDLTSDVREALTELEALKVGLDVEEVNKQIGEIKQAKQKLDSQLESAVESVASHIEARIEKELKSRLRELDQEYQQIVKNVSVEIIKKDLDELKALKKELKQELARFRGTQ